MCLDIFDVVLLLCLESVDLFSDFILVMCEGIINHIFDSRSCYSADVFSKRITDLCFVGVCCFMAVVAFVAVAAVVSVGIVGVVLKGDDL